MRLDLHPWEIFGCNIAKWTILCIVVHFQPVIKLLQKGVRVHQKRVILMQKMQKFSGEGAHSPPQTPPQWVGGHPLPTPHPLGASILTPSILKFCLRYWVSVPRELKLAPVWAIFSLCITSCYQLLQYINSVVCIAHVGQTVHRRSLNMTLSVVRRIRTIRTFPPLVTGLVVGWNFGVANFFC